MSLRRCRSSAWLLRIIYFIIWRVETCLIENFCRLHWLLYFEFIKYTTLPFHPRTQRFSWCIDDIIMLYTLLRRPFCRGMSLCRAGFLRFSSRFWNDCSPKVCYCCLSRPSSDVCFYHCCHLCGTVSSATIVCCSWNWTVPSRNRHSDNSLADNS